MVHRGDGGVSVVGPGLPAHGDVDAGRGAARRATQLQTARQPTVLPLPLRPRALGLHRRPLGRPGGGRDPQGGVGHG